MLPELGAAYAVRASDVAVSVTAYLLPFAVLMLVSGTLGERWGRQRTVRLAYVVYVVASLLCAVAPTLTLFLAARGLQGIANAFTTPLLYAALAGGVPPERLGRALGWFGSLQAAGQTSAPLVGGLAAEVDWRWAFVASAAVSLALAVVGIPASAPVQPAALRTAWRVDVLRAGIVAAVGWGFLAGLNFLVALRLEDAFGLSAGPRGVVLTGLGIVGLLTARLVGSGVDRLGARRCVQLGSGLGALVLVGVGLAPAVWLLAAAWAVGGIATQLVLVGVNALVLRSPAANRAGSMSVVQAIRFGGGSLSPVAFTPVYDATGAGAFFLAAGLVAVVTPLALPREPP